MKTQFLASLGASKAIMERCFLIASGDICKKKGIIHQSSCGETPSKVADIKNRHFLEFNRLSIYKVPNYLSSEAVSFNSYHIHDFLMQ